MLTMTRINDIRKAYFNEGLSITKVAVRFKVDRKTARKYINMDDFNEDPRIRRKEGSRSPKLKPYTRTIDEWLEADLEGRVKQRHTARRVYKRLKNERPGFDCSYRTVAAYVKEKKQEIYSDTDAAIPLVHKAGEAQVDFGSADFIENGTRRSGKFLVVSFPYSNAGYLQLFRGENRECLLEGLKAIFEHLVGVPRRLWFDNMSTVVTKVLKGGERELCDGFIRFKEHYGFESAFCNPNAGHEKGNVENKVGYYRRNLLVPVPEIESLERYNEELLRMCDEDNRREHYRKDDSIETLHLDDKEALRPLPAVEYDCANYATVKTDLWGKFKLGSNHTYSTAPRHAGGRVLVRMTAGSVVPLDENHRPITTHRRLYGSSKQEEMDWLPYLTQLSRNPGAMKYSGVWDMLPDALRRYLDGKDRGGQREVLRALALLSEQDGFERAVRSGSEAASRGLEDLDSLLAIHGHLHGEHPSDRMAIDEGILPNLPQLPKVPFQSEVYDSFLVAGGRLPC